MEIYVGNLDASEKLKVETTINWAIPSGYKLNKEEIKIDLSGTITNLGDFYLFEGEAKAILEFACDLCLEPVNYLLSFPVVERYSETENEEEEVWGMLGKSIDLGGAVKMNLLLNLPIRRACSENCSGLCPVCGQNLNKGACNCASQPKNSFFEGLEGLFSDKEV
ncbi:MAG: DUF177 domain-containing protein [Clostridiales bacterium]|jgi:uncharacterized protein|nr:DUF177 domain-containing protein [Clostridiales bacterium]